MYLRANGFLLKMSHFPFLNCVLSHKNENYSLAAAATSCLLQIQALIFTLVNLFLIPRPQQMQMALCTEASRITAEEDQFVMLLRTCLAFRGVGLG